MCALCCRLFPFLCFSFFPCYFLACLANCVYRFSPPSPLLFKDMNLADILRTNPHVFALPADDTGADSSCHLPSNCLVTWRHVGPGKQYIFIHAKSSASQLANSRAAEAEALLANSNSNVNAYYGPVWIAEEGGLTADTRALLAPLLCRRSKRVRKRSSVVT